MHERQGQGQGQGQQPRTGAGAPPMPPPTTGQPPPQQHAGQGNAGDLVTREEVRMIVHHELAAILGAVPGAGSSAPQAQAAATTTATAATQTPETQAAIAAAQSTVAAGIARGAWGQTDRDALHPQLALLSDADQMTVLLPLLHAINAQQVELDGSLL